MSVYICPVCKSPLTDTGKTMRCENNHSYDISAKGYVNLLKPGKAQRGDDIEMVSARRRFLSGGHYAPLCDEICGVISKIPYETLLDAGCGEGYYTEKICEISNGKAIFGLDISKKAAEKASSLCKTAHVCAASAYDMPYADDSFDVILNVFSPLALDEYKRVLKQNGRLVMAVPEPEHLIELKRAVYDNVFIKEMKDTEIKDFTLLSERRVLFTMRLDAAALKDLFMMTPYYRKTGMSDKEKLDKTESLSVTASFAVFDYIKK
jgi:23S rRNA (guanine745-N1)-methyltransferase